MHNSEHNLEHESKRSISTSSIIFFLCFAGCLALGLTALMFSNQTANAIKEIPFRSNVEIVNPQADGGLFMGTLEQEDIPLAITVKNGKFVQGEGDKVFVLGENNSVIISSPAEVSKFEMYPQDHITTFVVNGQQYRASIFNSDAMRNTDGSLKQWTNANEEQNVVLYGDKRLSDDEYLVISTLLPKEDETLFSAAEASMNEMLASVQFCTQNKIDLPDELNDISEAPFKYINSSIVSLDNGDLLGIEPCSEAEADAIKRMYKCKENEWKEMKGSGIENGYVYLTTGLRYSYFEKNN